MFEEFNGKKSLLHRVLNLLSNQSHLSLPQRRVPEVVRVESLRQLRFLHLLSRDVYFHAFILSH